MTRRIQNTPTLQAEFMSVARASTGKSADEVRAVVHAVVMYLQEQYGGSNLYVSKRGRVIDVEALRADYDQRVSVREICRRHNISHRTFRRLIGERPRV